MAFLRITVAEYRQLPGAVEQVSPQQDRLPGTSSRPLPPQSLPLQQQQHQHLIQDAVALLQHKQTLEQQRRRIKHSG